MRTGICARTVPVVPEGHTIHRIARDHGALLIGRPVRVSSPQGRFSADAARVDGATLERIEAYGKHLFHRWSTGDVGHVHLGLFGKFTVHEGGERPEPRGAVRMRLESDTATIDLSGPTACSVDDPSVRRSILARLGPDPLRPRQRIEPMLDKMLASRRSIGDLVMDQSVIAGIGNVYRAEVLFACGIHPLRPGTECDRSELEGLWATIRRMMRAGVRLGRIITVDRRDVGIARTRPIPRREATYAYKRDRCVRCGTPIETVPIANRTAYFCPTCQPR